jgi:phage baseplate assembly protein W
MPEPTYIGVAFPFSVGLQSFPDTVQGDALVRQSIEQIVMTNRGERVMRPDFGTRAFASIGEAENQALKAMIIRDVWSTLSRYEPRALVNKIDVEFVDGKTKATIYYTVLETGNPGEVPVDLP